MPKNEYNLMIINGNDSWYEWLLMGMILDMNDYWCVNDFWYEWFLIWMIFDMNDFWYEWFLIWMILDMNDF